MVFFGGGGYSPRLLYDYEEAKSYGSFCRQSGLSDMPCVSETRLGLGGLKILEVFGDAVGRINEISL